MYGNIDYSLYLVTDRELLKKGSLETAVREAICGGVTLVQLREKNASSREFYRLALSLKEVTDSLGVHLIINDRLDIALAAEVGGVHLGQDDLPVSEARRIMGIDAVIGVSASTVEEALEAERDGADYLGVGAMFATGTKKDAKPTAVNELFEIRRAVSIPVVAIGGIGCSNIGELAGTGIDGISVVSAILCRDDIRQAAADLKSEFTRVFGRRCH